MLTYEDIINDSIILRQTGATLHRSTVAFCTNHRTADAICHRLFCYFICLPTSLVIRHNKSQIVATRKLLLQKHAGPTAAQPTLRNDRYAITQYVSLVHKVSRQDYCSPCETMQYYITDMPKKQTTANENVIFNSLSATSKFANKNNNTKQTKADIKEIKQYFSKIVPVLYFSNRSQIERLAYGSTPAVGSSRITTREPAVNAMAIDSFRCIPPNAR